MKKEYAANVYSCDSADRASSVVTPVDWVAFCVVGCVGSNMSGDCVESSMLSCISSFMI